MRTMLANTHDVRFSVDSASGLVAPARQSPSPNCDDRPLDCPIVLIVVHGISLPPGQFGNGCIAQFFCNQLAPNAHPYFEEIRSLRVSAHALIDRDGGLTQFVPFTRRAWHAGESTWHGQERCNDFSVGIELEGTDELAYTDSQYVSLSALIDALRAAFPTLADSPVVGHSDIAPGRKTDPGEAFDWSRVDARRR